MKYTNKGGNYIYRERVRYYLINKSAFRFQKISLDCVRQSKNVG